MKTELYFCDEALFKSNDFKPVAWSNVRQNVTVDVEASKRETVSVIGAVSALSGKSYHMLLPSTHVNSEIFVEFLSWFAAQHN
jgi:hypothetical protein